MKFQKLMIVALALGFTSPVYAFSPAGVVGHHESVKDTNLAGANCVNQKKAPAVAENASDRSAGAKEKTQSREAT